MLPPVRCTCGKSFGAYYAAFSAMRAERMKLALDKHPADVMPSMIAMSDELQPLLGDILDSLHIHRSCCRQRFITHCNFSDYY